MKKIIFKIIIAMIIPAAVLTGCAQSGGDGQGGYSFGSFFDQVGTKIILIATDWNLSINDYLNFGRTEGETGHGFRSSSGTMQYKNTGGSWANIGSGGGSSTTTLNYWIDNTSTTKTEQWDAAYGYGPHAGYYDIYGQATATLDVHTDAYDHDSFLTSYTETDPAWLASSSDYLAKTGGVITGSTTVTNDLSVTNGKLTVDGSDLATSSIQGLFEHTNDAKDHGCYWIYGATNTEICY